MVMITRGSCSGSRSGSSFGAEPIDERLYDLITTEVTRVILYTTPGDLWYLQGANHGDNGGSAQVLLSRDCYRPDWGPSSLVQGV